LLGYKAELGVGHGAHLGVDLNHAIVEGAVGLLEHFVVNKVRVVIESSVLSSVHQISLIVLIVSLIALFPDLLALSDFSLFPAALVLLPADNLLHDLVFLLLLESTLLLMTLLQALLHFVVVVLFLLVLCLLLLLLLLKELQLVLA